MYLRSLKIIWLDSGRERVSIWLRSPCSGQDRVTSPELLAVEGVRLKTLFLHVLLLYRVDSSLVCSREREMQELAARGPSLLGFYQDPINHQEVVIMIHEVGPLVTNDLWFIRYLSHMYLPLLLIRIPPQFPILKFPLFFIYVFPYARF